MRGLKRLPAEAITQKLRVNAGSAHACRQALLGFMQEEDLTVLQGFFAVLDIAAWFGRGWDLDEAEFLRYCKTAFAGKAVPPDVRENLQQLTRAQLKDLHMDPDADNLDEDPSN